MVDDLPIGCAPQPRLQVVHDPAAFAETENQVRRVEDVVSASAHLPGRSGSRDRTQAAKSSTASTTRSKRME